MTDAVLRFTRSARPATVPGEAVYLRSESGPAVRLAGPLVERVTALLDGTHSRAQVVQALSGDVDPAAVHAVVDKLIAAGHVTEADPGAAYWEALGHDGSRAVRTLRSRGVRVLAVGDVSADAFTAAADAVGLRVDDLAYDVTVVLTDDYLRDELEAVNRRALAGGGPWLLCKPRGTSLWMGPVFEPGATACYACLRVRLSTKDRLAAYLANRGVTTGLTIGSTSAPSAVEDIGTGMAALRTARWLLDSAARDWTPGPARVTVFDTAAQETSHHELDRRPQCAACGDPALQAARGSAPVELWPHPVVRSADGGHRTRPPQHFVDDHARLISPITGVVSSVTKVPLPTSGLHVYLADHNFAIPVMTEHGLKTGLRSVSAGKGMTDVQARASAIGEAVERYSGVFHGDEARIVASLRELGPEAAIAPNDVHLYSAHQFAARAEWNAPGAHSSWVGDELDPNARVEWSPVWSLTHGRHRYLPTSALYFGYTNPEICYDAGANSNGCAGGTSLEDAILQGFFELVERDALAIWWYNRLRRPEIDLATFDLPHFHHWRDQYRSLGRRTWVLDVTTDLGVPVVAAVSSRTGASAQDIIFGFGAHFDVRVAIGRALSEMNQFLHATENDGPVVADRRQLDWWRTATTATETYLTPADTPPRTSAAYPAPVFTDVREAVLAAEQLVRAHGMEMLVLDQTRVDVGTPVARVVVPGLRHFWPRFGAGRLYDVPVALGWLDTPTPEEDLNPIAMFL